MVNPLFVNFLTGTPMPVFGAGGALNLGNTLTFGGADGNTLLTKAATGDVTWAQDSFVTSISAGAVTLTKLANIAASTILGNNTGAPAAPIAMTMAQTWALLGPTAEATVNAWTAQQYGPTVALTDAASISWDANVAQNASLTINGNRTLSTPTNLVNGGLYTILITQGAGGSHTLAYSGNYKFPSSTKPVLSTAAGAIDLISFLSDGTNMYGVAQLNFG